MKAKLNLCKIHHATGCLLSSGSLFSAFFNFVELKRSQQPSCQRALHLTNVFSNPSPSSSGERSFCIGMQWRSLNFAIFQAKVLWTDPTSHERLEISRTPLRLYFVLLTNGTFIPVGLSNSIGCCLFISATDTFQHFFTNNSSFRCQDKAQYCTYSVHLFTLQYLIGTNRAD